MVLELPKLNIPIITRIETECFHGTKKENTLSILKDGFKIQTKECSHQHMGAGVYFWERCMHSAQSWGGKNGAVLQATVALGKCLDLTTTEHVGLYTNFAKALFSRKPDRKPTDALVFNALRSLYSLDSARAPNEVQNGAVATPIFRGSKFKNTVKIMICVYDHTKISDIKVL